MSNSTNLQARTENLVIQEMSDEVLVYDLNTNKAHSLNQTAAFVWKKCDGTNSVTDITALLEKEFHAPVQEDLVWLAIDQLGKDNLLEAKEITSPISGMSRREVVKRIGLASVVALPIVASLIAPSTALAGVCSNCAGDPGNCGQVACPGTTICNASNVCVAV
jgi:Coenzyme PQQ synthesis protein D (PqqD)